MRPSIFVLLALSLFTHASLINHEQRGTHLRAGHHKLSSRINSSLTQPQKRCKGSRSKPYKVTSAAPEPTSPKEEVKPSSTAKSSSSSNSGSSNSGSTSSSASGVLHASSNCGASGATKEITATSGPNGNIDFLNCGITGSGWQPPYVTANQLVTANFETALSKSGTPFKSCEPYWDKFRTYANQHGFNPMILAAIAMQESGCNPNTVGGGGEQGLMQITKDKCGGAPGGNCKDVDYNIRTGAAFFASTLAESGGNVIETLGKYNGWYVGLTKEKATAARWSDCCRCQNNLDYLQQTFNGWLQNRSAGGLGIFNNLAVCF